MGRTGHILRLRFLDADGGDRYTLAQVGRVFKLSGSRIGQLERRGLELLEQRMTRLR